MIEIGNTLVSLDVVETFFCCDLEKCKGQCCIEGDAGAPLLEEEKDIIEKNLHMVKEYMSAESISQVEKDGVSYIDSDGDLVTMLVDGRDCVFTCHDKDICLCAIERACRAKNKKNFKPISCSLYPVRLTQYPTFVAVNYHKWDVCQSALQKGKELGIRMYEFLKEPLTKHFGKEWYDELELTAKIYLEEKRKKVRT